MCNLHWTLCAGSGSTSPLVPFECVSLREQRATLLLCCSTHSTLTMEAPLSLAGSTAPNSRSAMPISRLQLMQANFQNKLLQEKEKKMLQLYPDNNNGAGRPNGGTVRQFFAQRRALQASGSPANNLLNNSGHSSLQQSVNGSWNSGTYARNGPKPKQGSPVGWDKSYPLSPLDRDSSGSSSGYDSGNSFGSNLGNSPNTKYGTQQRAKPPVQRKLTVPNARPTHRAPSLDRQPNKNQHAANGNVGGMRRSNSQILPATSSKENEYSGTNATTTRRPQAKPAASKPANTVRKPPPRPVNNTPPLPKQPLRQTSSASDETDHVPRSVMASPKGKKPLVPAINYKPPTKPSTPPGTQAKKQATSQVRRSPSAVDPNLVECSICGRRFAPDRVEKHETICEKSSTKKRKVFDPTKMRIKGTDIEEFVRKSGKSTGRQSTQSTQQTSAKKPDWRQKRNNFIETIRQAKAAQKHLAAGGKLSDLPPPPPMDTSDYIQCPFCNRKFSEAAAERHIPKCKNIKSNKNADRK